MRNKNYRCGEVIFDPFARRQKVYWSTYSDICHISGERQFLLNCELGDGFAGRDDRYGFATKAVFHYGGAVVEENAKN